MNNETVTAECRDQVVGGICDTLRALNQHADADKLVECIATREEAKIGYLSQIRFALQYATQVAVLQPGFDLVWMDEAHLVPKLAAGAHTPWAGVK